MESVAQDCKILILLQVYYQPDASYEYDEAPHADTRLDYHYQSDEGHDPPLTDPWGTPLQQAHGEFSPLRQTLAKEELLQFGVDRHFLNEIAHKDKHNFHSVVLNTQHQHPPQQQQQQQQGVVTGGALAGHGRPQPPHHYRPQPPVTPSYVPSPQASQILQRQDTQDKPFGQQVFRQDTPFGHEFFPSSAFEPSEVDGWLPTVNRQLQHTDAKTNMVFPGAGKGS